MAKKYRRRLESAGSAVRGSSAIAIDLAPADQPSAADGHRLRVARVRARGRVKAIERIRRALLLRTFREELGGVVRCVSPFLVGLLASEDLTLDQAMLLVRPCPGWPARPRLFDRCAKGCTCSRSMASYYRPVSQPGSMSACQNCSGGYGHVLHRNGGGCLRIDVRAHSIEVDASLGHIRLWTRLGRLWIALPHDLPESIRLQCIGRPVEDVVDHPALRGHGWRVVEAEGASCSAIGNVLIVSTGSTPYVLPWVRQGSEQPLRTC